MLQVTHWGKKIAWIYMYMADKGPRKGKEWNNTKKIRIFPPQKQSWTGIQDWRVWIILDNHESRFIPCSSYRRTSHEHRYDVPFSGKLPQGLVCPKDHPWLERTSSKHLLGTNLEWIQEVLISRPVIYQHNTTTARNCKMYSTEPAHQRMYELIYIYIINQSSRSTCAHSNTGINLQDWSCSVTHEEEEGIQDYSPTWRVLNIP